MQITHISLPVKKLLPVLTKAVKSKALYAWFVPMNDGIAVTYGGGTNGETHTYEEVFLPGISGGDYAFQVELRQLKAAATDEKRSGAVKVNFFGDPDSVGVGALKTFKVGQGDSSLEAYRQTLDERDFTSIGIVELNGVECANPQDFLAILKAWVPWLKTARDSLQLIELRIDETGITATASDGHGLANLRLTGSATHSTWFRSVVENEGEPKDEIILYLPLKAVERLVDVAALVKGVTDITLGLTDDHAALQVKVGNHLNFSDGKTRDYREVSWVCLSFDLFDGRKPDLMGFLDMHRKAREYDPGAYLVATLDDRFARSLSDALDYRRIPAKAAKDLKCELAANDTMLLLYPAKGILGDGGRELSIRVYNSVSLGRSDVTLPDPVQSLFSVPCENPDKALGATGRLFRLVAMGKTQAWLYGAIAATLKILPAKFLATDGEVIEVSTVDGGITCQVVVKPQLIRE